VDNKKSFKEYWKDKEHLQQEGTPRFAFLTEEEDDDSKSTASKSSRSSESNKTGTSSKNGKGRKADLKRLSKDLQKIKKAFTQLQSTKGVESNILKSSKLDNEEASHFQFWRDRTNVCPGGG
jgi:hypothetical protein